MPRSTSKKNTTTHRDNVQLDNVHRETASPPASHEAPAPPADVPPAPAPPADAPSDEVVPAPNATWDELYAEWRRTDDPQLRERLIMMHHRLVIHLARRFAHRGEMQEDIVQQGLIGLIQALDHFDPERGAQFSTFATPRVIGEIRRYLRDRSRGVRLPRRVQELTRNITQQVESLTQKLNRSPTYAEIALHLGVTEEDVIEAVELGRTFAPLSLDDNSAPEDETALPLVERLGEHDAEIENYEEREALRAALERLPASQQEVLRLAYFQGHSQTDIARRLNVSQMHISRLLRRALAELRAILDE